MPFGYESMLVKQYILSREEIFVVWCINVSLHVQSLEC